MAQVANSSGYPKRSVGESSGGLTLPGYDYIGPGNKVFNEIPKNPGDVIAQSHDISYSLISNKSALGEISKEEFIKQIQDLDDRTGNQFYNEYLVSGNWGSLIGAVGLKAKYAVEKLFGTVFYPGE